MTSLSKVFELNPQGLDWRRGVMFLDVMLVPLVVLWAIGGYTGSKVGAHYTSLQEQVDKLAAEGNEPNAELAAKLSDQSIRTLHAITVIAFTAILVLMIFKPGA